MAVADWLRNLFGFGKTKAAVSEEESGRYCLFAFEEFYLQLAIQLIAGTLSKCEFRTFWDGKPVKREEYYLWNYEPNRNQNSSEFLQEFLSKLLYQNEALILDVGGELLIADGFCREEHPAGEDIFRGVYRGDVKFWREFPASEVLYFRYANRDVRALLSGVASGYRALLDMAIGKYKRAGGRKGIVRLAKTASGTDKDDTSLDDLFRNKFKRYFSEENAVLNLPRGMEYEEIPGEGSKKSTSDLTDITNIMREAAEHVALALKIPPPLLLGNVADLKSVTDTFLTFCIDPLADLISEEITRKRYGARLFASGSYLAVDTAATLHEDIFEVAEKIDKLIASGAFCIDELRQALGKEPLNEWWSRKHWITKNYEQIAPLKGGEGNRTEGRAGDLSV